MKRSVAISLIVVSVALLSGPFNNCAGQPGSKSGQSSQVQNCALAPAALRSPDTIDEVTALVNALPKPLTLPCFIANLATPLKVSALQSTFSAQPSESTQTPRVFIINGAFTLSVVPTGIGKDLLEMGQMLSSSESVKAELKFPITANISAAEPYDHIRSGSGTNCIGCHTGERDVAGFPAMAFASSVVRPNFSALLPASQMRQAALACDQIADPYRCAMMRAIFVTGQAQDANFP